MVPAPEWDALLNIKVFNANIFKASHLHSLLLAIHPTSSRVKQVSNYWSRQFKFRVLVSPSWIVC